MRGSVVTPGPRHRKQRAGAGCELCLDDAGDKPEGERVSEYALVTDPVVPAVCEEDVAKVRALAGDGASLNEPEGTCGPPRVAAVRNEDFGMLSLLLELGANGANYGLSTRGIVTWLAKTGEQHPFELQGCGHDFVAIRFTEPIDDYEALHAAIESFCPDTSGEEPTAPAEPEDFYANDRRCFFWWD